MTDIAVCIVAEANMTLASLKKTPGGEHIKTGDIRRLSASLFRQVKGMPIDEVFAVCEGLLAQRDWTPGVIAFDFAYRMKAEYSEHTFDTFERWLETYVRGWGDCDDFCTHAFGELLCQQPMLIDRTFKWVDSPHFWMRRAAAVILIHPIHKGLSEKINPLRTADLLIYDDHDLVRKGYGWMLKTLSEKEPDLVFDYLTLHKVDMPRVAYRYARGKYPADKKRALMQ